MLADISSSMASTHCGKGELHKMDESEMCRFWAVGSESQNHSMDSCRRWSKLWLQIPPLGSTDPFCTRAQTAAVEPKASSTPSHPHRLLSRICLGQHLTDPGWQPVLLAHHLQPPGPGEARPGLFTHEY